MIEKTNYTEWQLQKNCCKLYLNNLSNHNKIKFVLASGSPRRKEILTSLGIKFVKGQHRFSEHKPISQDFLPSEFVKFIAQKKAESVKEKYKNYIIISADTIVVLKNEIIGKPRDVEDAKNILTKLSGTKHKVYSGVCLMYPKKNLVVCDSDVSTVFARKLTKKEIMKLSTKHLDKAGAYAVQEKNDMFVKKIVGDYYNVVGFPVNLFIKLLSKMIFSLIKKA